MGVIFVFIDGIGLGNEKNNPFIHTELSSFLELSSGQIWNDKAEPVRRNDLYFTPLDATLGVEGLPQSGTGQAALFSGKNAAKLAGRHYGPFPHSKTRFLLKQESLFHSVQNLGKTTHFINGYPDIFFNSMEKRPRWTCTTMMAIASGQRLNRLNEIQKGEAITAEIVQKTWREQLKLPVRAITEEQAAERLLKVSNRYDLTLFEYYLSDKAGHSRDEQMSRSVLETLDRFIGEVLSEKREEDLLVICSDHGNLEDLSKKSHTRNPVPFAISGKGAGSLPPCSSIMDVMPMILRLLTRGEI